MQEYVITVNEVDAQPDNWTSVSSWPHKGLFVIKGDTNMYRVGGWCVDYLVSATEDMCSRPISASALNPQITEDLFLKAISAAANSKILSREYQLTGE